MLQLDHTVRKIDKKKLLKEIVYHFEQYLIKEPKDSEKEAIQNIVDNFKVITERI